PYGCNLLSRLPRGAVPPIKHCIRSVAPPTAGQGWNGPVPKQRRLEMTNATKQRPVKTLRDGAIKAAIWQNESEHGPSFAVTFARSYKDSEGKLHANDSFSGAQLLQLARLADRAYSAAAKLTREARTESDT